MFRPTDDLRIEQIRPLIPPAILMENLPLSERASTTVAESREAVARVLRQQDDRLVVVVGPCSIHDVDAAREYARGLHTLAAELSDALVVVMRVYFEKPRTTVGWKGLINDPRLDGTFRVNEGLSLARSLLLDLAEMGVPAGCEFLDTISTSRTWSPGARSARARPRARCTASSRRACLSRSDSRTAPTATSRSRSTRSRPPATRTISCR
jgi:3-deoxy-7-phosphoheptulonate synthase